MSRAAVGVPSKRDLIRAYAAEALSSAGGPLHVSRITEIVRPRIPHEEITQKMVNTSLHDDTLGRFESVAKATWKLRR